MKAARILVAVGIACGGAWAQQTPAGARRGEPTAEEMMYQAQLRQYVEQMEAAHAAARWRQEQQEPRVTIHMRQETVPNIVREFARQGRITILLDETNIDPERRMDFQVQDVPFRQALRAFMDMADLYFVEDSPTLIRLAQRVRTTLSFTGNVADVIELIAKQANANVVIHPAVTGTIKVTVSDVPWDAVVQHVVTTAGFALVREPWDIYRVVPRDMLLQQMETEVFQLRYITPPPLYRGQFKPNDYVTGAPSQFTPPKTTEEWVKVFPALSIIQSAMSRDARGGLAGALQYDPDRNAVVVTDTRTVLNRIQEILQVLDREPTMVLVGVRFVSTTNRELFDFGIQWARATRSPAGAFTVGARGIELQTYSGDLETGDLPGTGFTALPFGLSNRMHGYLTFYDLNALLRLFEGDEFSRVSQEPIIATLNNMEATIFSGRTIRFAEQEVAAAGVGSPVVAFREARNSPVNEGFQLVVIPNVIEGTDELILTIIPSMSVLTAFQTFGAISLPQIASQTMVTRLRVRSGQTVVMGGLTSENQEVTDDRVPFFADLPIAGWLFKRRNLSDQRQRLLVLLTPSIVRGSERTEESLRHLLGARREGEQGPVQTLRAQSGVEALRERIRREREREQEELRRLRGGEQP